MSLIPEPLVLKSDRKAVMYVVSLHSQQFAPCVSHLGKGPERSFPASPALFHLVIALFQLLPAGPSTCVELDQA